MVALVACDRPNATPRPHPVVGTWLVHDPNAPFPYHLYVFNADGTMHQANPDAGDPRTSDSDGKGVWVAQGDTVHGRWVELLADRTSHAYAGRLEVRMQLVVSGDSLSAKEAVQLFDTTGAASPAPATPKALTGVRITLP
jgi:hypothetical protein